MTQVKGKINDLENQMIDLKMNCNSKIDGEEVRDIINKKFNILTEYKKDAEDISRKCTDITS